MAEATIKLVDTSEGVQISISFGEPRPLEQLPTAATRMANRLIEHYMEMKGVYEKPIQKP